MKVLYANGDSWTHGDEIADFELIDRTSSRYYNTWPWKLSRILDIPVCINDAQGGTGNLRIFRRTSEYIYRWLGTGRSPKDLTIVIGWSTPERTEIGEGQGIYPIQIQGFLHFTDLPRDDTSLENYRKAYYEVYSDDYGKNLTALYMMNLRLLCSGLGIKYFDFIAIGNQPQDWQHYAKSRWGVELKNMYMNGTWSALVYKNEWPKHQYGHPTKETHDIWADLLSKELV
jgi:hypothetical protein